MKRSIITLPDENFKKIQNMAIEQKKSGDRKASMNRIMNEAIEMYLKAVNDNGESNHNTAIRV